ncbi:MAG: DUF4331 family protein, partial [Chitinophagales bacterium]
GRRLEDDVTRIELQAVSGIVLAAIGLWYDDYDPLTSPSPVTTDLLDVLTFTTGVESNDTTFKTAFPYVQAPWSGDGKCSGTVIDYLAEAGECSAPGDLAANVITDSSAQLSFSLNGSLAYTVSYTAIGSGISNTVVTTSSPENITGLAPCTTYKFKVSSICAATGKATSAISSFTTTGEDCGRFASNQMFANIFPNPAIDVINITCGVNGASPARIIDVTGKQYKEFVIPAYDGIQTVQIDVKTLPAGLYFLEIKNNGIKILNKFIKSE